MDFICPRSIFLGFPCSCWSSAAQEVQFGQHAGLSDDAADTAHERQANPYPTPGAVLAKIAGVIAICLGLALLVQLLIPPPPGL
ncbi:MAG TPA: hypothetical protein VL614_18025 [Acetobacteraceae bacterium]|nr:hypothetical protein [Acetobacteraceae bacterium]